MASNKVTLVSIFGQGDIPQGTDFANLINSQVNIAETALQSMAGPLQSTEFDAPLVSAAAVNVTATLNAVNMNVSNVSATGIYSGKLNVTCDVSANGNTVYCSATNYGVPVIISALGTTQATAAQLTTTMTRGQGVADGTTTGFSLLANKTGWVQYFKYEGTVSANLWPPTGGAINNLGSNAAFPLVGGTPYIIWHTAASAYAVK